METNHGYLLITYPSSWDPILFFGAFYVITPFFFGQPMILSKPHHGSLEPPPRSSECPGRSRKPPSEAAGAAAAARFFFARTDEGWSVWSSFVRNLLLRILIMLKMLIYIYPSEQTMILNLNLPPKHSFVWVWLVIFVTDSNHGIDHHVFPPSFWENLFLVHFSKQGPNFSKSKILKGWTFKFTDAGYQIPNLKLRPFITAGF